jgi:hypothetical protein
VTEAALLFVVALLAVYLLAPAFRQTAIPPTDVQAPLEAARVAALQAIRDLELDWATGKLSDDDYHAQRAVLEAEVASVLRQLRSSETAS